MTFSSHVKIGGAIGFVVGGVLTPYFYLRSQEVCQKKTEIAALPYLMLALGSALGGGPLGAMTGVALYGTKKGIRLLRKAPTPVKTAFWGSIAASASGTAAHKIRRRD